MLQNGKILTGTLFRSWKT